jgi:hypothetical protein
MLISPISCLSPECFPKPNLETSRRYADVVRRVKKGDPSGMADLYEYMLIVSAPGCFRSAKPNVIDLILPPMVARYRVSAWEIAGLGHGGLLA